MSDGPTAKSEANGFGAIAVMLLFFWFWDQGGWYRVDCMLHVQKACDLVAAEYMAKAKP